MTPKMEEFYNDVLNQLQSIRERGINSGDFLLLNRDLYEEVRREESFRYKFVHKYEQSEIWRGDTFMGLTICVSESARRLCKVV